MTPCERFLRNVKFTDTCWLWRGSVNQGGYGTFSANGGSGPAHRFSYEMRFGPIPSLTLDHLCKTPNCVRWDHMEPVTHQENCQRGRNQKYAPIIKAANRLCRNGHWMGEKETYVDSRGRNRCRPCAAERKRISVVADEVPA